MSDKPIVINKNMLFEGFSPNITPKNKIENVTLTVKNLWYDSPEDYVTPDEEKVTYRFYQHDSSSSVTPWFNYSIAFEILSGNGDDIVRTPTNIQVKNVVNPNAPPFPASPEQVGEIYETTSFLINKIKFTLKIPEYAKLPRGKNVSTDFYLVANFDELFFVYETPINDVTVRQVDNITQEITINDDLATFKYDYAWADSNSYSFVVGNAEGVGDAHPRFGVDKVEFDYENMLATFYVYCLASIETSRVVAGGSQQGIFLRAILDATFSLRCKYYAVENETQTITYNKEENIGTTYDITNPLFDFTPNYLQPDSTWVLLHKEVADNILNSYEKGRSYGSLTTCYGKFYYNDGLLALSGNDGKIIEPLDKFKIGDISGFYNYCVVTKSEFDFISNKLYIDYIVLDEVDYEPQVFNETTLTFAPNTPAGTISLNIIAYGNATKVFNFDGTINNITSSGNTTITHTYSSVGQKNILISIPANDGTYSMGFADYEPFITSTHSLYLKELIIGKNVPRIDMWSFSNCSSLEKVIISDGVTSILDAAFLYCPLQVVELHCATPPTLYDENVFGNKNNVIIKVPKHLINKYKSASGWSYFANRIQAL